MIARIDPSLASAALVLETRQDAVTTLTLNRPERLNAIDAALGQALVDALQRASQDPTVRCVVLTGAGRGFCSGGDLNLLRDARERHATEELESLLRSGKQIVLAIATMPKPVLAAVDGAAAGAGCNLALACAPRIASDRAIFVQSFAKLGLFPDFGATYFLPRLLGPGRAAELLYTGETVGAIEAARLGLVSRVVPHDSLAEETAALAKNLAAAPPLVVRGIKQALSSDPRGGTGTGSRGRNSMANSVFQSKDSAKVHSGVLEACAALRGEQAGAIAGNAESCEKKENLKPAKRGKEKSAAHKSMCTLSRPRILEERGYGCAILGGMISKEFESHRRATIQNLTHSTVHRLAQDGQNPRTRPGSRALCGTNPSAAVVIARNRIGVASIWVPWRKIEVGRPE